MTHTIPVPLRLQRPRCTCGHTPPLPWRCTWAQFDTDTTNHLAAPPTRRWRCAWCARWTAGDNVTCPVCGRDLEYRPRGAR